MRSSNSRFSMEGVKSYFREDFPDSDDSMVQHRVLGDLQEDKNNV